MPSSIRWAAAVCLIVTARTAGLQSPNIVLIALDDSGYADLDNTHVQTPNIQRLFAESTQFVSAYVTAPQCSPSRVSMLTGIYHQRFGHESNDEYLVAMAHENATIIPRYLPPNYVSAAIGKWNLGDIPNPPIAKGFHQQYLYRNCDDAFNLHRSITLDGLEVLGIEYRTSIMFAAADDFIRKHADHPFFLYLAPMSPHPPYVYHPKYEETFYSFNSSKHSKTRRKVLTMTKELDDGIGRILAAISESRLVENTVIFFINDNGAPNTTSRSGDQFNSNYPYSGYKGELYEGGIHVRFSVRWIGRIPGGVSRRERVSSMDILPTIIDITSGGKHNNPSKHRFLDGKSLMGLLGIGNNLNSFHNRDLYWRFSMNCRPLKAAIIEGDLKLIHIEGEQARLFNLSNDVSESNNILGILTSLADRLMIKLMSWQSQLPELPKRLSMAECHKLNLGA